MFLADVSKLIKKQKYKQNFTRKIDMYVKGNLVKMLIELKLFN